MMHWYGDGVSGWGFVLMALNMILFWGLIITGVVALIRYLGRGGQGRPGAAGPERILAERFARGEIDEQEYQQRLQVLRRDGSTPPKS